MNRDIGFFVTGGLLLLACLLKLPALIRVRGRDWLLSSICALLLVGAGVLFTAAQSTIVIVNRVTGVTNIAAPLIYILLTGFSGASIVLVLNWRDGPDAAQTRRLSRITIAAYGAICTLIMILFALGDTPVEQRTTFDTYYATTPYIREMIVLYITAHAIASLTVSRLCWRWSGEVQGTLRIGLRVLAVGYLMHYAGYDTAVAAAVAARWAGHNWNFLIGIAYITTQPSALLVSVGFILPLIGHRAEDAIRYAQLATLARAVRPVQGAPSPAPLPIPWWKPSLRLRLTQRQTYISDRLVASRDDFSLRIWDEVRTVALGRKNTEEHATAIADAAMIAAAVDAQAAPERAPEQTPASDNRAEYTSDLADISRALRSGIVRDLRRRRSRPKKEADT